MVKLVKVAVVAGALAVAAPAAAQYTFAEPGQPRPKPVEVWENVGRVNLGVGFYNSGWYNCWWGWYWPSCTAGSYTSYIPFLVGPQVDLNLGGMHNLSLGFTFAIGTISASWWDSTGSGQSRTASVVMYEPTVDYVAKFGPPTQDTVGRFRVGGGMYFGQDGGVGGAFRIGGGASFLNANRLGFGLDVVLEGGGFHGYWIGGIQLLVSPEIHF